MQSDMQSDVTKEHQQLKTKLDAFIDQARENERKMHRFHELELRLIAARSLSELLQSILYNYSNEFSLDKVTLSLIDTDFEVQRILEHYNIPRKHRNNLVFFNNRDYLDSLFGASTEPVLGGYQKDSHQVLFNDAYISLNSIAILPLVRYGELIGSLNLGSTSSDRFSEESATDFLQRLSTIVAICIENSMNHERLKRVGLTDGLTGINNRRFFDQRLGEEIARSVRTQEPMACLFLDLDHFKAVNDQYGHKAGDKILRDVANIMRAQLRNSDVLGRYGGEEFVVLLLNTNIELAQSIAERIRKNINQTDFLIETDQGEQLLKVTVSMGVSTLRLNMGITDIEPLGKDLVENADQALYQAKNVGRNNVQVSQNDKPIPNPT